MNADNTTNNKKEIFYTLGEDKQIDKLFKKCRKKIIFYEGLFEKLEDANGELDEVFVELRRAVEEKKGIKLPNRLTHDNAEGTLSSV